MPCCRLRIRHYEKARLRALGVSGLAWAGALAIAFYITRSVSRPLAATARQLASRAQQMASTAGQVSSSAQSLRQGRPNRRPRSRRPPRRWKRWRR